MAIGIFHESRLVIFTRSLYLVGRFRRLGSFPGPIWSCDHDYILKYNGRTDQCQLIELWWNRNWTTEHATSMAYCMPWRIRETSQHMFHSRQWWIIVLCDNWNLECSDHQRPCQFIIRQILDKSSHHTWELHEHPKGMMSSSFPETIISSLLQLSRNSHEILHGSMQS